MLGRVVLGICQRGKSSSLLRSLPISANSPLQTKSNIGPASFFLLLRACSSSGSAMSRRQSPIDIKGGTPTNLPPLKIEFQNLGQPLIAQNTGTTLHIESVGQVKGTLSGGPVGSDSYSLQQFHFHWGDSADHGSEHTLDGKKYSAELHYVFKNEKYPTMGEAVTQADGLAVAGVLIAEGAAGAATLPQLFSVLPQLTEAGSEARVSDQLDLTSGLPSDRTYFTYLGSLTTPGYNECVTWILFKTPVSVSSTHMALLRKMRSSKGGVILNNWREVQDLCDRPVSVSS